ncbi:hypothetical protein AVEN_98026-1 [Araneus ventricosus]|uniref:Uncharacterized protein n=1 Tax=Araneus ventricosus TaxID=182803 RepID=A0A4Y2G681_ARAVE|nr:hypothetical protein AVEN_98026-1 [Araneus ventricosus]
MGADALPRRYIATRNIIQTSVPYPVMLQFSVEKVADNCAPVRWSPVLLKDESRGVSSQLWKQPQHIQVHGTCHCLLDEGKGPMKLCL